MIKNRAAVGHVEVTAPDLDAAARGAAENPPCAPALAAEPLPTSVTECRAASRRPYLRSTRTWSFLCATEKDYQ